MRQLITIDARMLSFSGIGTYVMNLLTQLASVESEFKFDVICREPELSPRIPPDRFRFLKCTAPIYSLREHWEIARLSRGTDLLHCPHYNIPCLHRGRLVVTIHDLTHLMHPDFLPNRLAYWYARFMLATATKRATRVVTVSQYSRKVLQERFNVPDERIQTIYNGLPHRMSSEEEPVDRSRLRALKVSRPYVLFVGRLKPHKNVGGLLRAFSLIHLDKRRAFQLVIVGKRDGCYPSLRELAKELALEEQVVFTGAVADADLHALYEDAAVLVLPSLNEGFGYPVLEAMAHGVPVIASNRASLPEVVGTAGVLVDPTDPRALANTMERVLSEETLRRKLIESGRERVKLFSARESALQHLEVYREAMGSSGALKK